MTRSPPRFCVLHNRRLFAALALLGSACFIKPALAEDRAFPSGVVIPTSGARFTARLTQASADGVITFAKEELTRTMPLAELVRWGALVDPAPPANPARGAQALLADGGVVVADAIRAAPGSADKLWIDSALFGERKLPVERVAGVLFQPPLDARQRDRLTTRLLARDVRSDRLLLENGDELAGVVLALADAGLEFETADQKITVPWPRVTAVAFDSSLAAAAKHGPARILLGFADGSRLVAASFTLEGKRLEWTLADGGVWQAPAESLVLVQPLSGTAKYLSDMQPEGYRHLPYLSLSWPYRNDANASGTRLRAGGRPFAKGVGMHSAARLTYRLDKAYKTFEAELALDDQVGSGGSVVYSVYVDDKLAHKSDVIRGGAAPTPIHIDTTGGKRLSLIIEFADRGDELDHANWLDARLFEAQD